MVTALISALTGRAVRHDIAMTGEVSLRGKVLAIGGLKEKTMAAYSAGVKTVLIPQENLRDMEDLDPMARDGLIFVPCRTVDEVLLNALLPSDEEKTEHSSVELLNIPAIPPQRQVSVSVNP